MTSHQTLLGTSADTKEIMARTSDVQIAVAQVHSVQQSDHYKNLADWLSAPDPWSTHASACQRHQAQTGQWLLQSDEFQAWKAGAIRHLWLYGMVGCGKTVLCSAAIEHMRTHCSKAVNAGHAIFYFSFTDAQKQSYENMFRSLVAQLAWKGSALAMLEEAYKRPDRRVPALDELERIFLAAVDSFDTVYVQLDALDESPEDNDVRQYILERLKSVSGKSDRLRIFATSRESRDVREAMYSLQAQSMPIPSGAVNADIKSFVSTQLSNDSRLCSLRHDIKLLIEDTISRKADGMFRWAACQLQELKKMKSMKPKYVKDTLSSLPATLEETYERMLTGIEARYREEALRLLRWLMYSRRPLWLSELAEAAIIDPTGEGTVDVENRGGLSDTLDILAGLVTVTDEIDKRRSMVYLAHFSVKEYLESDSLAASNANEIFHMNQAKQHQLLSRSCIAYIFHYSGSDQRRRLRGDSERFPLLWYATLSWAYHSRQQEPGDVSREVALLTTGNVKRVWVALLTLFRDLQPSKESAPAICWAAHFGLNAVVESPLNAGADVNAQGVLWETRRQGISTALQAASWGGFAATVKILIDRGADVNARGSFHNNALESASYGGHKDIVEMLLDKGADVSAQGGRYGNALRAAAGASDDREDIVQTLLDHGAHIDANAQHGTALQDASWMGNEKIVQLLLEHGADVNARGGRYGTALRAARYYSRAQCVQYRENVIRILLENGAVDADDSEAEEVLSKQQAGPQEHNAQRRVATQKALDEKQH